MEITLQQLTNLVKYRFFKDEEVLEIKDDDLSDLILKLDDLKCDIYAEAVKSALEKLNYKVEETSFDCSRFRAKVFFRQLRLQHILLHLHGSQSNRQLYCSIENKITKEKVNIPKRSKTLFILDRRIKETLRQQRW
ncbi:MAG: hypothetical protein ACC656_05125 [Candidatus Heimdallarchaeota archaeon]